MNKLKVSCMILAVFFTSFGLAKEVRNAPKFVKKGVICDIYFCVNNQGVSVELTKAFLGKGKGNKIAEGSANRNTIEFTFSNGVYCNTKLQKCYLSRFYNERGEVDGAQRKDYSSWLFDSNNNPQ